MTTSLPGLDSAVGGVDVIADLARIRPESLLAMLRAQRPEAATHAQGSYAALFDPAEVVGLTGVERLAVALRVAGIHAAAEAAAHYRQRLADAGAAPEIVAVAELGAGSDSAGRTESAVPARLPALLRHADLLSTRPVEAGPDDLQVLADAGLSTREIVTLAQIIAFVSFQVRVVAGLRVIGGHAPEGEGTDGEGTGGEGTDGDGTDGAARSDAAASNGGASAVAATPGRPASAPVVPVVPAESPRPARVMRTDPALKRPTAFTVEQLAWTPWLEPVELADATPEQLAALEGRTGNSPYFRLLAHEPAVLTERTATDKGIFYTRGGAPRAERELAAAATSRLNGCIYCASVHARLAAQLSKRPEDVDRLLREGVGPDADLGLDPRWQGIVDFSVALAKTPSTATAAHVARLREVGLTELEILDVAQSAAFFSWANRLMLTLGDEYYPDEASA